MTLLNPQDFMVRFQYGFDYQRQNQWRYDYTGGPGQGQPVYVGVAKRGLPEDQQGWNVAKFTYDVNGFPLTIKCSEDYVKWSDRASLTYE